MRDIRDALCVDELPDLPEEYDDGVETWADSLDYWLRGEDDVPDCG